MDPVTLALLGTAVASGGVALDAAQSQNRAIDASKAAAQKAGLENQRQIRTAASQKHEQRVDEFNQLAARILVARGEAGVGTGGSTAAVTRQAEFDTAEDLSAINLNAALGTRRVATGTQSQLSQLDSQRQNPLVSAFLGGLQGAGQGLQIVRGLESFRRLGKERA